MGESTLKPTANIGSAAKRRSRFLARWLVLTAAMVLVALPRFDRNKRFVNRPPRDDVQYQLYVEYFRGHPVADQLRSASTWRPIVPLVAATLPLKPMTAINVVNLAALSGALYFLLALLAALHAAAKETWIGGLLFAVSFPTFYYATIGYVDPGGLFFVSLGLYLCLTERWIPAVACAITGVLAKESAVVLIPVLAASMWARGESPKKIWILTASTAIATIAISVWIRSVAPGITYETIWTPAFDILVDNARRPTAWLSALLTIGLPGLGLPLLLARRHHVSHFGLTRTLIVLLIGVAATFAMWLVAFTSAYVDGRTLWPAAHFLIPVFVLALRRTSKEPSIRFAELQDADALARFGEKTFRDTYARYNTVEDMDEYVQTHFSRPRLTAEIADEKNKFIVSVVGSGVDGSGTIVGYAKLSATEADPCVTGRALELERIYVDAEYKGRGVGRALMQFCLKTAANAGYETVWLGVWKKNERAFPFYEKAGFTEVGSHVFLLGQDEQTDLVLQRDVTEFYGT